MLNNRFVSSLTEVIGQNGLMEVGSSIDTKVVSPSDRDFVVFSSGGEEHLDDKVIAHVQKQGFDLIQVIDGSYRIIDRGAGGLEIGMVVRGLEATRKYVDQLLVPTESMRLNYIGWAVGFELPEGFAGDIHAGKVHIDTPSCDIALLRQHISTNIARILRIVEHNTYHEICQKLRQIESQKAKNNLPALIVLKGVLLNFLIRLWYTKQGRICKSIKHFYIDSSGVEMQNDPLLLFIQTVISGDDLSLSLFNQAYSYVE